MKPAPRAPLRRAAPLPPAHFKAKFVSECYGCGEEIERGELIRYDSNDHVLHAPTCPEIRRQRREKPTKFIGSNDDEMGF